LLRTYGALKISRVHCSTNICHLQRHSIQPKLCSLSLRFIIDFMAFELKNTVPWGRNLEEYTKLFALSAADLERTIISFGDGPASFNAEMAQRGRRVCSLDPIYQFSKADIKKRIEETKAIVLQQAANNRELFVWDQIASVAELEAVRMSAMSQFLDDFDAGKEEGRYLYHELPEQCNFEDQSFDLGLSSHFLILYDQLGLDFHIQSISEMLRICKEVRIFPILNLNSVRSEVLDGIMAHFSSHFQLEIVRVDYEFQKGGNEMLVIKRK